jgi:hypothetical protein
LSHAVAFLLYAIMVRETLPPHCPFLLMLDNVGYAIFQPVSLK